MKKSDLLLKYNHHLRLKGFRENTVEAYTREVFNKSIDQLAA